MMTFVKKYLVFISILICFFNISIAHANQTATAIEAEKLFNVMGIDKSIQSSMGVMLNMQIQQNPKLKKHKAVIFKFFHKHMSYQSLKPDLIELYTKAFTAQELRNLTVFYQTPTGRKALKVLPGLVQKGGQLGVKRMRENMGELVRMIKENS